MKQKGVLVLSLVTLATVVVAALALRHREAGGAPAARARLFAGLDENAVAEITVQKGGKSATVRREGGQWKLVDRGGYPAKFEQVKQTVVRLAGLEIEEQKTARPDYHARLGLKLPEAGGAEAAEKSEGSEEGAPPAEAALVALKDAGGKELAALVVGKTEWRGSTQKVFVRRPAEDQVYLCDGRLDLNADAASWIATDLVKLENDRVQDVAITHADGEEIRIGRSATNHTQFRVENVPPDRHERYEGVANGAAQALSSLTLEDVRPAGEVDFTKEPLAHTRYRCHDGLELLVESAKQDGKTWVKITASYVEPPEPEASEVAPAEGEKQPPSAEQVEALEGLAYTGEEGAGAEGAAAKLAEAVEAKPEEPAGEQAEGEKPAEEKKDIRKEAEDLNARFAPWAYALPQWKADVIVRRMKDLLAEPPSEATPAEEAPEESLETPAEDSEESPLESPQPEDDEGATPPGDSGGAPSDEKPPGG